MKVSAETHRGLATVEILLEDYKNLIARSLSSFTKLF